MSIKKVTPDELMRIAHKLIEPAVKDLKDEIRQMKSEMHRLHMQIEEIRLQRKSDQQARQALSNRTDGQMRTVLNAFAKFEDDHK